MPAPATAAATNGSGPRGAGRRCEPGGAVTAAATRITVPWVRSGTVATHPAGRTPT